MIQESALFSSRYEAPIRNVQVFTMIKITVICQVGMSPAFTGLNKNKNSLEKLCMCSA